MVLKKILSKARSRQKSENSYIAALDIGTEYVKAIIAKLEDSKITVVGVGRSHQELSDMHSGAISDISGVVKNCENALSIAEKQAGIQAKQAVIGIAGELVKGTTNTIKYRRPQSEKPLDVAEIELIIDKVQERAYQKAKDQISLETGNDNVEIKLVNSALVSIYIDGYKVSNPIGFQGKDVAIQIYTAYAPLIHIGALEKVASELSLELVAVAAEPFAVARSVVDSDAGSTFTAILVDVGGGTTDIAVVNDGGVEGTKMFGIGGRSFTNTIANELEITYKDAEKLKVNIDNEALETSVVKDINEAIDKTLEVWIAGVEIALSEFDNVDHLPNKILLCGGGASLNELVNKLKESDWYKELPFTKKPSVHHIKPEDVVDIVDDSGDIKDHTLITALGLLRVGHDTIIGSSDHGSIKEKLNRLLRM